MSSDASTQVKTVWDKNIQQELTFWRQWFKTKGLKWPEEYVNRLNPDRPLQSYITDRYDAPVGSTVRLLDVGSGPLTLLGKVWAGRKLEIHATDALAEPYNALIDEFDLEPPVRTEFCEAERLIERFGAGSFDIAHAKNCLDHCYNPVEAIRQMVEVVRAGGMIYLGHNYNEGERQGYKGLHQWNFCNEGDRFIVWRGDDRVDVGDALDRPVEMSVQNVEDRWLAIWISPKP